MLGTGGVVGGRGCLRVGVGTGGGRLVTVGVGGHDFSFAGAPPPQGLNLHNMVYKSNL